MPGLIDIPGILVGHTSDYDGLTGCTAILCPAGAVGGYDLRGSASGTLELALLSPLHLTKRIHAVVLAGGSAFGLDAASGVRAHLEKQGIGYDTRAAKVPLVVGAILYDLAVGNPKARPTREMGRRAAANASAERAREGAVGAGTGATVGKIFGMARAMKSGIGAATVELSGKHAGVRVSAMAVVNAFGDVVEPATGKLLAGARTAPDSLDLANTEEAILAGAGRRAGGENTTLVVTATNASLTKPQATKLAQLASLGVARAIRPVWTTVDGDIVFALSIGDAAAPLDTLGVAAARAVSQAIIRAVRHAPTLGGLPGVAR